MMDDDAYKTKLKECSYEELLEIQGKIDKEQFPLRFQMVNEEISGREKSGEIITLERTTMRGFLYSPSANVILLLGQILSAVHFLKSLIEAILAVAQTNYLAFYGKLGMAIYTLGYFVVVSLARDWVNRVRLKNQFGCNDPPAKT